LIQRYNKIWIKIKVKNESQTQYYKKRTLVEW
jgi:hypothetical protein